MAPEDHVITFLVIHKKTAQLGLWINLQYWRVIAVAFAL